MTGPTIEELTRRIEALEAALELALQTLTDPYLGEDDGQREQPIIEELTQVLAKK